MSNPRPAIVSATGIEITDGTGRVLVDLAAAMASSLGHRDPDVVEAVVRATQANLGSGLDTIGPDDLVVLGEPFDAFSAVTITPSASAANECAIRIARAAGQSTESSTAARFRIVTLLGSDHGDTLACRSASGRIDDQARLLPLVPGFRHVSPGDIRAIEKAIDEQTIAVMLAPVDWTRGGEPWDHDYLAQIRKLCDDRSLLMIVDETRLPVAISGHWFFHQSAGIVPDVVTAAAGWTGGLPGGLVLVSQSAANAATGDPTAQATLLRSTGDDDADGEDEFFAKTEFCGRSAMPLGEIDYPLLRSVVETTAAKIVACGGPGQFAGAAAGWHDAWQTLVDGFEFVSGCTTVGFWTVTRCDLPAKDVSRAAWKLGLRWSASSDTTLLACWPVGPNVAGDQGGAVAWEDAMGKLRLTLETVERQTIES